jgi:biotin synthase
MSSRGNCSIPEQRLLSCLATQKNGLDFSPRLEYARVGVCQESDSTWRSALTYPICGLPGREGETENLGPSVEALRPPSTNALGSTPVTVAQAQALYEGPFFELLFRAHSVHRRHFDPNKVQLSRLLSIKTGGCPEDCGYCSQSAHYRSGLKASKLMDPERVIAEARKARDAGATRYCMGAAWREPKGRDMGRLAAMISGVKALGLETCMTLGMLNRENAERLKEAGLDYYNHNIDTSAEHYGQVITTHTFAERLATLAQVRACGMKVCCGGILGMGESAADRIAMLVTLANLEEPPESVPINRLMPIPGTPLAEAEPIDALEFVRTIALARILMPRSFVRLSAGRTAMSDEMQALCFFAGANSIFVGDTLLTAGNPSEDKDAALFRRLGIVPLELPTRDTSSCS